MHRPITPPDIAPPRARYSHAMEVEPGCRWVVVSGQLGVSAEGVIPPDVEAQAEICFANIASILRAAGMEMADIVRVSTFVTGREHLPGYMAIRDKVFAGATPPASTLLIIAGLSRPEFVVEIEAIAAKRSA